MNDYAERTKRRKKLLEKLGIDEIFTSMTICNIDAPISETPISSGKRFYIDEDENEYILSSEEDCSFMDFLDQIVEENPTDNGKARVMEFLKPYKKLTQK